MIWQVIGNLINSFVSPIERFSLTLIQYIQNNLQENNNLRLSKAKVYIEIRGQQFYGKRSVIQ